MMLRLSRFVTPPPFHSASQFCQRPYQSRVKGFFWLITRHFSVKKKMMAVFLKLKYKSSQRDKSATGQRLAPTESKAHYPLPRLRRNRSLYF
jgi:hypothetical protein